MNCVTFRVNRRRFCGDIAFDGLKTLSTNRVTNDRNLARFGNSGERKKS